MPNIRDKDFDEFVKRSTEGHDIPFEPSHWERLEKKIEMGEEKKIYTNAIRKAVFFLSFLAITLVLWLSYDNGVIKNTNKKAVSQAVDMNGEGVQKPDAKPEKPEVTGHTPARSQPAKSEKSKDSSVPVQERSVFSEQEKDGPNDLKSEYSASKKAKSGSPSITDRDQNWKADFEGNPTVKPMKRIPPLFNRSNCVFSPIAIIADEHISSPSSAEKEIVNGSAEGLSKFYICFNAAANSSSVGFSELSPPGFGGGVTLEYFIGEKVSLVTGVMYSHKIYTMNEGYSSSSYYPSSNYYSSQKKWIDHVDGQCAVLDIPLNLRYYFITSKKHLFFLSSGLSSYIMLNEAYDIYYAGSYGEETKWTKKLSNENEHFFGVINFSFGYERVLSDRVSLQMAPFVKVPITDIGDGQIGLTSAGAFFSLKYRIR